MDIEVVFPLDVMGRKLAEVYFIEAVRYAVCNVSDAKEEGCAHYLVWVVDLVEADCKREKREHGDDRDASLVRLQYLFYLTATPLLAKT